MSLEFFPFNVGTVLVMEYDFLTHKLWERDYKFEVSRNGRLTFRRSPALFQGMKPARLGQYTLYRGFTQRGDYHHMAQTVLCVFDNPDYEAQKVKFLRQVLKHVAKNIRADQIELGHARMHRHGVHVGGESC